MQKRPPRLVGRTNFETVVALLSRTGEYGFDTETTGLAEHDRIFSAIFADEIQEYYFNFHVYADVEDELILPRQWISRLQPIFNNPTSVFYITNAKFDMGMGAKDGLEYIARISCNQAMERLLRNNLPGGLKAYSLDNQAKRIGETKDKSVDEYIKKNKLQTKVKVPGKKKIVTVPHFDRVPFDIISPYGGHDAYLHRRIGRHLKAELDQIAELARVRENEERLTKTCFRIERTGIRIDRDYTQRALDSETAMLNRACDAFSAITGEAYQDSKELLVRVFTAAGERIPKTAKGNDSLTDEILETFKTPAAKAVQRIRYHEKRIGTYYSSFLFCADRDGVIRANINQAGTETGRFSYSNPNLQNVPKEDEAPDINNEFLIRGCFIPRPGYCFVMIDYSQQEYRMLFDYAGQRDIVKAIMAGEDAHQATANLLGITRKKAKNTNFAYLYGAGDEKLAITAGVTVQEAHQMRRLYGYKLPYVEQFKNEVINVGRSRGYIKNWFGRRCHISSPEYAYILPNHLIQGGCADVAKVAMNRLDDYLMGKKSRMLLQVHDEILFEVHESELDIVVNLRGIMESVYPPRNGMTLEACVEHSWKSWSARDKVKGPPSETTKNDSVHLRGAVVGESKVS